MKQTAVSNNIYAIRNHYGLTQEQFANRVGVSQVTVSKWETQGHDVSDKNVKAICDAFPGITYDDIKSDENGFARKVNRKSAMDDCFIDIPLYGSIAAGTPIEMIPIDDECPVPVSLTKLYPIDELFALRVKGHSMDKILPDGCIAIIWKCSEVVEDNDPYAICVNGFDATIKRVKKLDNGFELIPDSTDPTLKPKVYDFGVPGTETITLLGKVVHHMIPVGWHY